MIAHEREEEPTGDCRRVRERTQAGRWTVDLSETGDSIWGFYRRRQ